MLRRIVLTALLFWSQLEGNARLLRKPGYLVLCEGKEVINGNCSLLGGEGGEAWMKMSGEQLLQRRFL